MPLRIRRRTMLKGGLGGAVIALGGVGLHVQPGRSQPSPQDLTALDARQFATLFAVAECICPPLGHGAPGAAALEVARRIDLELGHFEPEIVDDFRSVLDLLESGLVGLLFGEHARPFTRLSPGDQARVLDGWRQSGVAVRRAGYRALRSMVAAVNFSAPETWSRIGYVGPPSPAALRAGYAANLVDYGSLRASPVTVGSAAAHEGTR